MKTLVWILTVCAGCAESVPAPAPVGEPTPCAVQQKIDQARLIRLADGGTYNEPCVDGGP